MSRLLPVLGAVALGACALNAGRPTPIDMPIAAIRADPGASSDAVADALTSAGVRAAFVAGPSDGDWYQEVAEASELTVSGPAELDGLGLAFLAPEPLGDTTLALEYDGGHFTIHDALYEIEEDRLLDLMAFRVPDDGQTRSVIRSLLEYIATDVNNAAALVVVAAVPSAAVGDSVARMLSPAYYDAIRCEIGRAAAPERNGIRLFYGPAARMYCEDATLEDAPVGEWIRAGLVMGRR